MLGAMQDFELRVMRLLDHAAREHWHREIVTRWADGSETRTTWAGVARDARKLAQALERMGLRPGDRVATLGMNHSRHLVAWYGAIGMGGVIPHDQSAAVRRAARIYRQPCRGPRAALRQGLLGRSRPHEGPVKTIEHYIVFDGDGANGFEAVIAQEDGDYSWVEGSEREPCMLCYTSGTTGNPKGVLYEHRSTVIHALAELQPAEFDLSTRAVVLPIVPMFHAAAWGLPFACAAVGAKFVYSAVNDPVVLCELMNREKVTHSAGVPTVWFAMFQYMDASGAAPEHLRIVTIGGSAAPRAMIERLMRMGGARQPRLGNDRDLADRHDGGAQPRLG